MKNIFKIFIYFFAFGSVLYSQIIDIRNPMYFVKFYLRTPSGLDTASVESNITYINSKTDILIHFNIDTITALKDEELEIIVYAEIIDSQGKNKPISVAGYSNVITQEVTGPQVSTQATPTDLKYRVTLNARKNDDLGKGIIDTEIPLTKEKLLEGDKLVIRIENVKKYSTYTKTFEIAEFGWQNNVSASAVWIKTFSSNNINFQTAPSVTYEIFYKFQRDISFITKYINPSFGPQVTILDINQTKTIGLGFCVSTIGRTIQTGVGMFLNSTANSKDKTYYYIGVNFIEGIEILN